MNKKNKIRVGVIFGGPSKEHEVSLSSARSVIDALPKEKYDVVPIAITKQGSWLTGKKAAQYLALQSGGAKEEGISVEQSQSLVVAGDTDKTLQPFIEPGSVAERLDIVLPLVHGSYGEDGRLQGFLEMFNMPYVFSGPLASALGMDKPKSKIIAKNAGLEVLPDVIVTKTDPVNIDLILASIKLPVIVKPAELGSSVGISIAQTPDELSVAITKAFELCDKVMVEAFKKGRELTIGVFGNTPPKPLPIIEIVPNTSTFYDYEAKYAAGGSTHICPAEIPASVHKKVELDAVKIFTALECRDLARVDFIYNPDDDKVYFLEINTIPGMTATSLVPDEARIQGISFSDFLDKLITEASNRYK